MIKDAINLAEEKMNKTIAVLKKELTSMKAGRANPSMLDRLEIEYYGTIVSIDQVANVSVPEPRILLIQPYDKGALKSIEKAILKSDLGLNPSNDGIVIRLIISELTEETRKNIVKVIKKTGEETKIAVRAIRKDCNDKIKGLKKQNEVTEDEMKKAEEDIQKMTDTFIREVDSILIAKEKEIMSV